LPSATRSTFIDGAPARFYNGRVNDGPATLEFASTQRALAFLLPAPVRYAFAHAVATEAEFTAEEAEYLKRVRPRRRDDFTTGRNCAQSALVALGRNRAALGRESDGRPRWPEGVLGSLSHCEGLCVAAVAATAAVRLLGVDVEPRTPLPDGVLGLVASPREIAAHGQPPLDTVLFSAKESLFKALYPRVGYVFGFEEIAISLAANGSFVARLQPNLAAAARRTTLRGQFALTRDFVMTAAFALAAEGGDVSDAPARVHTTAGPQGAPRSPA